MGDVAIALSPDANSILYNASKLAMSDKKWGAAVDYTPWLRNLGINDIYLLHGAGYFQFGKDNSQRDPLDNTMRFSLLLNGDSFNKHKKSMKQRCGSPSFFVSI